jgi:hypothetical protein
MEVSRSTIGLIDHLISPGAYPDGAALRIATSAVYRDKLTVST